MILRSIGRPRQNIKKYRFYLNVSSGQVGWTMGFFSMLFLAILLIAQFQVESYRASALYMEDALAASNLASAVIDIEEFGTTGKILISEPLKAYEIYINALKGNLGLDENFECENKAIVSGKVVVERYIIYNVTDDSVEVIEVKEDLQLTYTYENLGEIFAPNGVKVESTGVYSEISFPVNGVFNIGINARKGRLVDIVAN